MLVLFYIFFLQAVFEPKSKTLAFHVDSPHQLIAFVETRGPRPTGAAAAAAAGAASDASSAGDAASSSSSSSSSSSGADGADGDDAAGEWQLSQKIAVRSPVTRHVLDLVADDTDEVRVRLCLEVNLTLCGEPTVAVTGTLLPPTTYFFFYLQSNPTQ